MTLTAAISTTATTTTALRKDSRRIQDCKFIQSVDSNSSNNNNNNNDNSFRKDSRRIQDCLIVNSFSLATLTTTKKAMQVKVKLSIQSATI